MSNKKQKAEKQAEEKQKQNNKENWKGLIVRTKKEDPPVEDGPCEYYRGLVTEDDLDGHCKVSWIGDEDEVGKTLDFHFENRWMYKYHFELEE